MGLQLGAAESAPMDGAALKKPLKKIEKVASTNIELDFFSIFWGYFSMILLEKFG